MRNTAFLAIALAGLALSACAPRYYDDWYGYDGRYYGPPPAYDRDRYNDRYYDPDGDQVRSHYYDYRDHY